MATATGSEWELARRWLLDARVLPTNHPVTRPGARLIDFANCLRDGVFLCALLNKLIPKSVAHYHPRASLQFKCVQNINAFLMSCHRDFGVRQEDLFQAADLYDVSDFAQVVRCLSALSKTDPAIAAGLDPFPETQNTVADEEDIYGNLENIAQGTKAGSSSNFNHSAGGNQSGGVQAEDFGYGDGADDIYDSVLENSTPAEDIYGSLVAYQKKDEALGGQQGSGFGGLPEKLGYVVAELLETEKSYVEALNMMVEHYLTPMKNRLDQEVLKTVFINLMELLDVHKRFLAALQRDLDSGAKHLSQCFLSHADDFVNYGTYCAKLPTSQIKVQELMDRPDTGKLLESCKKASKQRFSLKELLSVPMQRVLKYPLLIRELIKQGKKCDYSDVSGLETAQGAIQDVAKCVNEIKRDLESVTTMREIQSSLTDYKGENLSAFGRSLVDGEVKIKTIDEAKPRLRYAFLFDKAMLICKSKGEKFSFKFLMRLDEYRMEDTVQSQSVKGKMQGLTSSAAANSCQVYAKTHQAKTEWIENIQKAVKNLSSPGKNNMGHQFELSTIDRATARCSVCQRLMWGLILQGYVCNICESAVHSECFTQQLSPCQGQAMNPTRGNPCSRSSSSASTRRKAPSVPLRPSGGTPTSRQGSFNKSQGPTTLVLAIRSYQGVPPPPSGKVALTFHIGEDIEVGSTSGDWWEGRSLKTGATGFFLAAFVKPKSDVVSVGPAVSSADRKRRAARGSYEENIPLKSPPPNLIKLPALPGGSGTGVRKPPASPAARRKMYERYPWFVGTMSRADAELSLLHSQDGVFLIRESEARRGEYALSIRFNFTAKHIKIIIKDDHFYISQVKILPSMVSLVEFYQSNTLDTSFPGLTTTLRHPFNSTIGWCIAQYDFQARDHEELTIEENIEIKILSKQSTKTDWWYGTCQGQFGLFPSNYVKEI